MSSSCVKTSGLQYIHTYIVYFPRSQGCPYGLVRWVFVGFFPCWWWFFFFIVFFFFFLLLFYSILFYLFFLVGLLVSFPQLFSGCRCSHWRFPLLMFLVCFSFRIVVVRGLGFPPLGARNIQLTSLTDAGTPWGFLANQWEVMTRLLEVLYVFEHNTQYLLIHVPYTRIMAFWHISNIPP